jgi:hypothetical protein
MMNVREVTIAQPLSQIAAKALLSSASQREIAVLNAMPEETKERMQFFHDSKLRPNSKLALASDERALKRFLESKHSDVTVPQCSYGTVVEYLLFLHSEGKTQSTMKRALSSLKKLCPSLTDVTIDPIIRRGYKDTISSLMKSREKAVRGKDPVHEEEMWAMVDALQGTDAVSVMGRAYILLSWCSAARLNELRNLTVGDLKWVKSHESASSSDSRSGLEEAHSSPLSFGGTTSLAAHAPSDTDVICVYKDNIYWGHH